MTQPTQDSLYHRQPASANYSSSPGSMRTRPWDDDAWASGSEAAERKEDQDALALNTILDGIGRIHIAMKQDHAGRWRIRRTDDGVIDDGMF